MTDSTRPVGERRCWPCTVANAAVAAFVAGVPLLAALLGGEPTLLAAAAAWATAVVGYALYRLVALGYLPGSERVARATGLHERIGPGPVESAEDSSERSDADDRRFE